MQNVSRGILYLAFGPEFDKLTAASARYSRKFTDLPMCVLSNIDERSHMWKEVDGVSFQFVSLPTNQNRQVKVSLIQHTPFDETLFMDSDAVIQRPGVGLMFQHLHKHDLLCQRFGTIEHPRDPAYEADFIAKTYDKLASILGEQYPIELFGEAALLFRKTDAAREFFDLWERYWVQMGSGRDMPAFCFAVKHAKCRTKVFGPDGVRFCKNAEDPFAFIQHKGFPGFEKKFGLPEYKDWNPNL